ncbi:MAG: hypothetical protein Q8K82_11610, partial [Gemmatimonadaceae bacterium]|nr:hypothetical protein [Gemmatimonadaceae bacterium]
LPALRVFTAARRAVNSGEPLRAAALGKQAVALDSAFASAWSLLFVAYSNMGAVQSALDAVTHAYARRDRLSETDALLTAARYHGLRAEYAEEDAVWSRLVEMDREHTNYANMLLTRGRYAEAEAVQRRGVGNDPKNAIGYWNLVEAQIAQRKFAAAESTVTRMTTNLPQLRLTQQTVVGIPLAKRNFEQAAEFFSTPGGTILSTAMPQYPCGIDLARGRVRSAAKCVGYGRPGVTEMLALAEFRLTGDSVRVKNGYAAFLAAKPEARNVDVYAVTIAILAEVGKLHEARQLYEEWRARAGALGPSFRGDSSYALASIAAAEGQWEKAATEFLAWNRAPLLSSMHWYNRGMAEAATALARLGKSDSSLVLLERALEMPSLAMGWVYETTWYGPALQQLGDIYAARGERAKATEYYEKYVALMNHAEPPVAAEVAEVRGKLVRMGAEAGAKATEVRKR